MRKTFLILFAMALCVAAGGCGQHTENNGGAATNAERTAATAEAEIIAETEIDEEKTDEEETNEEADEEETGLRLTQSSSVRREKYVGEEPFEDFLSVSEKKFIIPGLNEAMVPQGISYDEQSGIVYISAYSTARLSSVIMAVDYASGEYIAEYFLYYEDGSAFNSHVGGLAVTETTMFVSAKLDNDGSYSIGAIALDDLPESGSHDVTVCEFYSMPVSPSFMSYCKGILWVGNFYHPIAGYELSPNLNVTTAASDGDYGCYILGFDMSENDMQPETDEDGAALPEYILAAPDRIQGMCFDGERVMLSQSYGRMNNSTLYTYSLRLSDTADTVVNLAGEEFDAYILDGERQISAVTAMPMTEGLCLSPEGNVLVLFESGAMSYDDGKFRTDYVWETPFGE